MFFKNKKHSGASPNMAKKQHSKKYIPAVSRNDINKILECENIPLEQHKIFTKKLYQEHKLNYLKSILPLSEIGRGDDIVGKVKEYTSISHHVWVTNIEKPRDIVTYVSDVFKHNKYNPNKVTGHIDHPDNAFIGSILNLRSGATKAKLPLSESQFYHVLWTNYSREDLVAHPELSDLRKICKIDVPTIELPDFIVLNIEDVMDKAVSEVKDQANPGKPLPKSVLNGLEDVKIDLLSVRAQLDDMKQKKMFASISDVVRVAAVKDIGGMYFDIDYNLFEQTRLHHYKQYNLFDLIKNYDSVLGKEMPDERLCNAIISSAKPCSKVVTSIWDIIKRNIINPDSIEYIRYPASSFDKIIMETGPIAATAGFLKAEGEYDIALDYGALYYNNFKRPAHELKLSGSVGAIGYDTWGGTWLECKYEDYKTYAFYDLETGRGITAAEWEAMF